MAGRFSGFIWRTLSPDLSLYRLTFRYQQNSLAIACGRFFLVSASGFVINELSYAFLLHVTNIAYDLLLAVILVAIAVLTFILSRYWVFRHRIS